MSGSTNLLVREDQWARLVGMYRKMLRRKYPSLDPIEVTRLTIDIAITEKKVIRADEAKGKVSFDVAPPGMRPGDIIFALGVGKEGTPVPRGRSFRSPQVLA